VVVCDRVLPHRCTVELGGRSSDGGVEAVMSVDASKCREIVDAHILAMMRQLGVQAWKVSVLYEPTGNPNWVASCTRQLPYQSAVIRIDPHMAESEEDVLDSLRHELIHVLLAPLDAYRDVVTSNIEADSPMDAAEDRAWTQAIETCVLAVERIFDWGLDLKPGQSMPVVEQPKTEKPAKQKRSRKTK
jgi:hydroxymethylpyrimidine/phosphomethylpyrimidine kinase